MQRAHVEELSVVVSSLDVRVLCDVAQRLQWFLVVVPRAALPGSLSLKGKKGAQAHVRRKCFAFNFRHISAMYL